MLSFIFLFIKIIGAIIILTFVFIIIQAIIEGISEAMVNDKEHKKRAEKEKRERLSNLFGKN
jgi:uncharacterized membrane protein